MNVANNAESGSISLTHVGRLMICLHISDGLSGRSLLHTILCSMHALSSQCKASDEDPVTSHLGCNTMYNCYILHCNHVLSYWLIETM